MPVCLVARSRAPRSASQRARTLVSGQRAKPGMWLARAMPPEPMIPMPMGMMCVPPLAKDCYMKWAGCQLSVFVAHVLDHHAAVFDVIEAGLLGGAASFGAADSNL